MDSCANMKILSSAINCRQQRLTSTIKSVLEPREYISSKMPYADQRYDQRDYNPAPNELAFMGGLGRRKTGVTRSKAHIQRPSANQILFKMRTANRILVSFTEDLSQSHSLTKKQLKSSPKPIRKSLKEDLKQRVSKVQIADNVIKTKRKQVSSTSSEEIKPSLPEVKVEIVTPSPTGVARKKSTMRTFSLGAVRSKISIMSALKGEAKVAPQEPKSFREWAYAEREKRFQAIQQVSYQQIKQEREANEIFPKVKKVPRKFFQHKEGDKFLGAEHLGGYLFGGFSKSDTTETDPTMKNQTKFHVPLTMFSRAEAETTVRSIYRKKAQRARMDYMKIPQIPSDSDDEDSDDVIEDIKGLFLVRTPYFRIPTIMTQKKKRSERIRTKFLQGNRLKRINALLFDRKDSAERNKQKYAFNEGFFSPELLEQQGKRDFELSCDRGSKESSPLPAIEEKNKEEKIYSSDYRQRYNEFLHEQYLEKLQQYNDKLNQKLNEERAKSATPISAVTMKTITDRKSFRDYSIESMSSHFPSSTPDIQKDPSFKKQTRKVRKNMKFSVNDNLKGGFYFDPFMLEKIHNPEKGMKISKNYTSLMRSQSNIRRRLHVNATTFDEEKVGNFYHRLVTEWDGSYISEIRYRPGIKKFCVKTDIIEIREMVRKKFFLYFMQENLAKLFATQEIESEMINKTNKFIKACSPQFKQLQDGAFAKAKEKLENVNVVQRTTIVMRCNLTQLQDELDLLKQKLMANERKWEMIMMMQNYYYLLMHPLWRIANDWIHRNKSGELDFLKKTIVYSKKIHIRSKSVSEISLHAIKAFFESAIEPKVDRMRQIIPEANLLKASLGSIKSNVLGILSKHNEIMLRSSEILFQQQLLEKTIPVIISSYQENMSRIRQNVSFIKERIEYLMKEVEKTSNLPLIKCVKNIFMRKIDAISRHLCKSLFTDIFKIDESIKKHTIVETFCMISNRAMTLLGQLDTLPVDILHTAEHESRIHRRNKMRLGKLAMNEQNLCHFLEKQLKNHFTPTFKPKRRRKKSSSKMRASMKSVSLFSMATKLPQIGK